MKKQLSIFKYGRDTFTHYFCPGLYLPDNELLNLHKVLININKNAKNSIQHYFLYEDLPIQEVRRVFGDSIICLIHDENNDCCGFLIAPLIYGHKMTLMHAGLIIIAHNTGKNLIELAAIGNYMLAYQNLGQCFTSNITSTPSIVEVVTNLVKNSWPSPKIDLVRPPRKYIKAFDLVVNDYVRKYFPSPEEVRSDNRRFVIQTASHEMGFITNLRNLSRSSDFEFINFCFAWLDYSKHEDVIQIGVLNALTYFKHKTLSIIKSIQYHFRDKENYKSMAERQDDRERKLEVA